MCSCDTQFGQNPFPLLAQKIEQEEIVYVQGAHQVSPQTLAGLNSVPVAPAFSPSSWHRVNQEPISSPAVGLAPQMFSLAWCGCHSPDTHLPGQRLNVEYRGAGRGFISQAAGLLLQ